MPSAIVRGAGDLLRPTRQWLAVSLPAPQQLVSVVLVAAGREIDVTHDCAVAALAPFTLRLSLYADVGAALALDCRPRLHLVDRATHALLGAMWLRHIRDWGSVGAALGLFEVERAEHYCAGLLRRAWDTWQYRRSAARRSGPEAIMSPAAVEQIMAFCICPRPVYFVSVDDGTHSNLFPMDLVGPCPPDRFTLALRNTSPSVETIRATRQLAMGAVPGGALKVAYQLGAHHTLRQTDWNALSFGMLRSKQFGLRLPDISLQVREIAIHDCLVVGSHTLFFGSVQAQQELRSAPQLFHTSGVHQLLRTRQGQPLVEAH